LGRFEFKHAAMGTQFSIALYATNQDSAELAADMAFRRITTLENIMSDYQADSELTLLCRHSAGVPVPVSVELFDVLQQAQRYAALSGGAFDATIGPYVRLWRFARKRKVLPTPGEVAAATHAVGYQKLQLNPRKRTATLLAPNMRLDLGGIAKGYAADEALRILKRRGIDRALVAASGDIVTGNPPPGQPGWKVGISPIGSRSNEVTSTLMLRNAAVSTSGDAEQFIEINGLRYSHIVNPATGLGLTERIQATIVGPNATTTDALATTVSVLGARRGLALIDSLPKTAAVVFSESGGQLQRTVSRRFPESFPREAAAGSDRVAAP
jgi:thiamine biosynthesis lipoprotein